MTIETKTISMKMLSIIIVLGTLTSFVVGGTMAWTSLLNRVSALEGDDQDGKTIYKQLIQQQNENNLTLVQIRTELEIIKQTVTRDYK